MPKLLSSAQWDRHPNSIVKRYQSHLIAVIRTKRESNNRIYYIVTDHLNKWEKQGYTTSVERAMVHVNRIVNDANIQSTK